MIIDNVLKFKGKQLIQQYLYPFPQIYYLLPDKKISNKLPKLLQRPLWLIIEHCAKCSKYCYLGNKERRTKFLS